MTQLQFNNDTTTVPNRLFGGLISVLMAVIVWLFLQVMNGVKEIESNITQIKVEMATMKQANADQANNISDIYFRLHRIEDDLSNLKETTVKRK